MSTAHADTGGGFSKRRDCPLSETLLAYAGRTLPPLKRQSVRLHLAKCDFCGAELQLLSSQAPAAETPRVPEAPVPLSLLLVAAASLPARHILRKPPRRAA
jgi:hypothetical protein